MLLSSDSKMHFLVKQLFFKRSHWFLFGFFPTLFNSEMSDEITRFFFFLNSCS